ncbi:hypothetical protein B0H16DRAFT_1408697, partial [Mycena metata]
DDHVSFKSVLCAITPSVFLPTSVACVPFALFVHLAVTSWSFCLLLEDSTPRTP